MYSLCVIYAPTVSIRVRKRRREGENVYGARGGPRREDTWPPFWFANATNAARVISARDVTREERKRYEEG